MKKAILYYFLLLLIPTILATAFSACKPSVKQSGEAIKDEDVESESESLYQINSRWDNQFGDTILLSKLRGKIPVMSMVFTRCTFACPRIVADMQAIEKKIPADKKDKVVFVLVSFDSDRDHTAELKSFTKQMNLNKNWLVLHGNEEDVRQLSMLLDVKYKKQPNGDFTHSSGITLLDTKGAIAAQIDGLGKDPAPILEKIKLL